MGQTAWGFSRDFANSKNYDLYKSMGVGGILLNTEDPNFAAGMAAAQAAGMQAGLWMPAHTGEDPVAYAKRLAAYSQQYHPTMLVPNVEFQGKGYKGSPGWDWSEQMMNTFRQYAPDQALAVSVMGNQDDFNYEAYTNRGAQVWAQAYGGDMSPWDTETLRQQLIARGVDPSLIGMTLAPNGTPGAAGNYSFYTLDDINQAQAQRLAQLLHSNLPAPTAGRALANSGRDPTPDVLARSNRNALDVQLLGPNNVSHILTQKEIDALTPAMKKAVAVQTHVATRPTPARTLARKVVASGKKPAPRHR